MHGLIPGDVISGNIAFTGFYEPELSRELARLASSGGVFVDVGANMGYFSLVWAANSAPNGRVVAFEASPRNVDLLRNNITVNGLGGRIRVIAKAAGRSDGSISFDAGPENQTGWGGIATDLSQRTITVPIVRLDSELPDLDIDVLKVDVEGADTWVLRGAEALLRKRKIRRIFFEQLDRRMRDLGILPGEAREFLNDVGYECVPFSSNEGEWRAYPRGLEP